MPQAVTSGFTAYCTAAGLFDFIDARQVGDLLRDEPADDPPTEAEMTDGSAGAGLRLSNALRAGSGEVEAACLPRGQYTAADLAAIAASETNAAFYLARVAAGCTIMALFGRRHNASRTSAEDYPAVVHAAAALERLRVGEHCFGLAGNVEAGKGTTAIAFVDTSDRNTGRLSTEAGRFFGSRHRGGY